MLKPVLLALVALSSLCVAQSPLNTLTGGTNSGNIGGGIYFDLQVTNTITINQIDIRCGANTVAGTGTMDIYLGPSTYVGNVTNAALWTLVSSTTPTAVAPSAVTSFPVTAPFALGPGNYGVALKSTNYSNGYTNGAGNNPPLTCGATPGSCLNSIFSNADLTLRAGAAQNAFLTGGIFSPRIFNGAIHYTPGGTPIAVAAWETYGTGCYDRARSFFEFSPSSTVVDFGTVTTGGSGITSMLMAFSGSRYLVSGGTNALYTHSLSNVPLAIVNDTNSPITLDPLGPPISYVSATGLTVANTVEMGANMYISLDGATTATINPTINDFLNGAAKFANWHDVDTSAAGCETRYEYDATVGSGAHIFTWLNAPEDTITGGQLNNFQILFYNNFDVEFRWGVMSQSGGGTWPTIMGFTPGGGARSDGGWDLSARLASPFLTGDVDNAPLTLSMSSRPLLGGSPIFATSNMEPTQGAGFLFIGFQGPINNSLVGFGMPECFERMVTLGSITTLFLGNPGVVTFPIANNPAFNGVLVYAQSVAFGSTFNTAFGIGINASNGVRATLGNL